MKYFLIYVLFILAVVMIGVFVGYVVVIGYFLLAVTVAIIYAVIKLIMFLLLAGKFIGLLLLSFFPLMLFLGISATWPTFFWIIGLLFAIFLSLANPCFKYFIQKYVY